MIEKTTIKDHLRNISFLIGQLANIGIVVVNDELVDCVHTNLLPSWRTFRQLISNRKIQFLFPNFKVSYFMKMEFAQGLINE